MLPRCFSKLVSGFSVAKGWFQCYPFVFKLVNGFQVDLHDIPLFFKLVNGFRLLLMLSHCFSWWSTVFGCFPYAFPLFSKLGAVATAIVSCEKPPRLQQQRFGWYLEVQLVSCKREGWWGGGEHELLACEECQNDVIHVSPSGNKYWKVKKETNKYINQ